jgi:hypothetical protein
MRRYQPCGGQGDSCDRDQPLAKFPSRDAAAR